MDSQSPAAKDNSRPEDRRRSKRFPLVVPVSLKWIGLDGLPAEAEGRAVEGDNHGGLLEVPHPPPFGTEATLSNLLSRQTIPVQVLSLRMKKEGAVRGLPVQFLTPNSNFWGSLGIEGQVSAELGGGLPAAPPPSLASRWRSVLHSLLGRPRM
jgi:hypothetical protein